MDYQTIIDKLQEAQDKEEKFNSLKELLDDNKDQMSFTLYRTMKDLIFMDTPDQNMFNELMIMSLNFQPNDLHKQNMHLQFKLNEIEKDYNDNLVLLDHVEGERDSLVTEKEELEKRIEELENQVEELQDSLDEKLDIDLADIESLIEDAKADIQSEVDSAMDRLFRDIENN